MIMKQIQTRSGLFAALMFLALALQVPSVTAQSLDEVLGVRAATTQDGKSRKSKSKSTLEINIDIEIEIEIEINN